jgi:nucleotide-binding universal stress UspA family protein
MFTNILVPLDGSELSERALQPALALANKPGAHLAVLRIPLTPTGWDRGIEGIDPYVEAWAEQRYASERDQTTEYLARIKTLYSRPEMTIETRMPEGDVARNILDAAAGYDLVVMSTHGYSGLTRWLIGSVAEKVVSAAVCPAMVVRSSQPIRRILIPLDGSKLGETALAPGLEAALRLNAEVILTRVVGELSAFERAQLASLGDSDLASRMQNDLVTDGENYLGSLVMPPSGSALQVDRQVLISGSPAQRLLEFAEQKEIDLIVMATHGRSGLSKWVYGSVTDRVLRHAHCSMLVIRPGKQHLN